MKSEIIGSQTPEEYELNKKLSELADLGTELAQHELDLATLQAELRAFEGIYLRTVGARLARLDEIKAQIAEAEARLKPKDNKIRQQAAKARAQAQRSAEASGISQDLRVEKFKPSESLRKLYRDVARLIHPDLAAEDKERLLREKLMADANRAYGEGDEAKLRAILAEWESSPESVKGEGTAAELVRVIRKIAQVKKRLGAIKVELSQLQKSDIFKLKIKAEKAGIEGRDLFAELALRVDKEIALASNRLDAINRKRETYE